MNRFGLFRFNQRDATLDGWFRRLRMSALTDIRNRDTRDALVLVCAGSWVLPVVAEHTPNPRRSAWVLAVIYLDDGASDILGCR